MLKSLKSLLLKFCPLVLIEEVNCKWKLEPWMGTFIRGFGTNVLWHPVPGPNDIKKCENRLYKNDEN